jgi:hypothetical protein
MSKDRLLDLLIDAADAALMALVCHLQEKGDERWRQVSDAQSVLAQVQSEELPQ